MDIPNFKIRPKDPLSFEVNERGITDFHSLCLLTKKLPYTRISDTSNLLLTLSENCGTCSSKHAFLKQVAMENGQDSIQLIVGIFKMNALNTPVIKDILNESNLSYIPEAHCYLMYKNDRFDFTKNGIDVNDFKEDILLEQEISPHQIGEWKANFQKEFIGNWLVENEMDFTLEEVWKAREKCIAAIAEKES